MLCLTSHMPSQAKSRHTFQGLQRLPGDRISSSNADPFRLHCLLCIFSLSGNSSQSSRQIGFLPPTGTAFASFSLVNCLPGHTINAPTSPPGTLQTTKRLMPTSTVPHMPSYPRICKGCNSESLRANSSATRRPARTRVDSRVRIMPRTACFELTCQ